MWRIFLQSENCMLLKTEKLNRSATRTGVRTGVRQEKFKANVFKSFFIQFSLFWVSWTEAVKEGVSNWKKWWISVKVKITLMAIRQFKNATRVNIPPLGWAIWGHIWQYTVEKSQTHAVSVILHHLGQAIWGDIWKYPAEKSQINAASVTLHLLKQEIWTLIWKYTVETNLAYVTSVILHPLMEALSWHIWKGTVEKNQTNVASVTIPALGRAIWGDIL